MAAVSANSFAASMFSGPLWWNLPGHVLRMIYIRLIKIYISTICSEPMCETMSHFLLYFRGFMSNSLTAWLHGIYLVVVGL